MATRWLQETSRAWTELLTELRDHHVDHIYVHYENLTSPSASMQRHTLDRMLRFLNWPELTAAQLECALRINTKGIGKREKSPDAISASDAYSHSLICRIWAIIEPWAGPLGYQPFRGAQCSGRRPPPAEALQTPPSAANAADRKFPVFRWAS